MCNARAPSEIDGLHGFCHGNIKRRNNSFDLHFSFNANVLAEHACIIMQTEQSEWQMISIPSVRSVCQIEMHLLFVRMLITVSR